MNDVVAAGLFGVAGAVLGAGLTVVGGVVQYRGQGKMAKAERQDTRGKTAGEKALNDLITTRDKLKEYLADPDGEPDAWRQAGEALVKVETAVLTIPDSEVLRVRMDEIFLLYNLHWWRGVARTQARYQWKLDAVKEGIHLLAAYLRDDPELPAPSSWLVDARRRRTERT
ncbi:hypothetical protein [Streptomyces apricus]|uniref:Uncharacterized protein n=1 Tax=Streptomyces apricus TaxID=1828112 RepID=A0A5B0A550_9ACTN|nr:hypothetical protein [Streptomyces apricus]KAA0924261.1 hypothetical protein FGF04_33105 [Streptomyces apricus]